MTMNNELDFFTRAMLGDIAFVFNEDEDVVEDMFLEYEANHDDEKNEDCRRRRYSCITWITCFS